ncbi:MAG: hypothetical protein AAF647_08895, partial [Pseudomonadota bacterium]
MASNDERKQASIGLALGLFAGAALAIAGAAWGIGSAARGVFLAQEEEIIPVIAGSDLDRLPALMRGSRLAETASMVRDVPMRVAAPRMCEMPDDYFDDLVEEEIAASGYTQRNEYVRKFRPRRGFLNER